jgi:hypothetical protein
MYTRGTNYNAMPKKFKLAVQNDDLSFSEIFSVSNFNWANLANHEFTLTTPAVGTVFRFIIQEVTSPEVSVRICEIFIIGRNSTATTETLPNTLLNLSQLKQNDTSISLSDPLNSVNGQMRFLTNGHQRLYIDDLLTQFQISEGGAFEVFGLNNTSQFYMNHTQTLLNFVDVSIQKNLTIAQNLTIAGDLTVNGTNTILHTQNITVSDPTIQLNSDNTADTIDSGFYSVNSTNKYSGLIRKASDQTWYLTESSSTNPSSVGNFLTNTTLGRLKVATFQSPTIFFDDSQTNIISYLNGNITIKNNSQILLNIGTQSINSTFPLFDRQLFFTVESVKNYNLQLPIADRTEIMWNSQLGSGGIAEPANGYFQIRLNSGDFQLVNHTYNGVAGQFFQLTNPLYIGRYAKFIWTVLSTVTSAGIARFGLLSLTGTTDNFTNTTGFLTYESTVFKSITCTQVVQLSTTALYSLFAQCTTPGRVLDVTQINLTVTMV